MNDVARAFAIEEFKALRSEILERSRMDHNIQRNAMLVAGAVLSFVFSREPSVLLTFVLLLVPIVLLVAHFQQARHKAYGMRIGRYISRLEEQFYHDEMPGQLAAGNLGWEHFLAQERLKESEGKQERDDQAYWNEVIQSLRGKGYSLSATVVDARYLTVGSVLFFLVAAAYLLFVLMT